MYITLDKVECGSNVRDSLIAAAVSAIDNDAFCIKADSVTLHLLSLLLKKFPYNHLVYRNVFYVCIFREEKGVLAAQM